MLLGFNITTKSKEQLVYDLISTSQSTHIISGNPEVLFNGLGDTKLLNDFKRNDSIIIPDGVGVVVPLKLKGYPIHKIAGIELFLALLDQLNNQSRSVFLLGGTAEVNQAVLSRLQQTHPNLTIQGRDGYLTVSDEVQLLKQLKASPIDALFVAMGCPKQEQFILRYRDVLNIPIIMGVGGSFDILSGQAKRAPKMIVDLNIEWLYRIVKEPFRLKRLIPIGTFVKSALIEVVQEGRNK